MKKISTFLFCSLLLIVLTACGSSDDEAAAGSSSNKDETLEVSIEDASYILSGQGGGDTLENAEGGLLQIDLQVKNISDTSIKIYPDMDMQLYDGETQIDPSKERNPALDLTVDSNNSIGADKQKNVSVLFNVEKDTEYELNISPQPVDYEKEVSDITIPIDTSEYNDSLEALNEPADALEAYVETIYFDKDNSNYEEFVSADKNDLQADAETLFADNLGRGLSSDVPKDDVEKYYESFKQASAEKNEIEAVVKGNANDKAIVVLNYTAISYEDISNELRNYKEKYREKNDGFDTKKEDEYALSKFDSVLDKVEAKKGTRELEVQMTKEDGKWVVDDSERDAKKRIMRVFAEGVVM